MLDRVIGHIIPDAWPKIVYWDEEADQPVMEAANPVIPARRHRPQKNSGGRPLRMSISAVPLRHQHEDPVGPERSQRVSTRFD
jgi:hypothetical protein